MNFINNDEEALRKERAFSRTKNYNSLQAQFVNFFSFLFLLFEEWCGSKRNYPASI